jgi:hypothetical protein
MPLWAQNGRELFYLSMGALMSVPVTTGSTFTFGNPSKLFDFEYFRQAAGRTRRVARWPTLCHDQAERRRRRATTRRADCPHPELVRRVEAPRSDQVTAAWPPDRIGPQPHRNFIDLFCEAPLGDGHREVAAAGEDGEGKAGAGKAGAERQVSAGLRRDGPSRPSAGES